MPLKYDPETGIPSYVPDIGIELEEGVTPAPQVITSKRKFFAGDRHPFRDGKVKPTNAKLLTSDTPLANKLASTPIEEAVKKAKPAKLDAHIATDSELAELEKQVKARQIKQWPLLRRLINRLRLAERG